MKSVLSFWIFDWRKLLAYSYRWLGIAGCVLFVAWFVSGVVMMYALSFTTMLPAWRRLKRHGRALAAWRPHRFAASMVVPKRAD